MGKTLGKGLSERLPDMLGEMLCKRLGEVLDLYMLQVWFRQASILIQESLNLLQLPSPDEGLVLFEM